MSFFDERIDRNETASVKWGLTKEIFGKDDLLPMWVADMDFRPPNEVTEAIRKRAEHGIFGYTYVPPSVGAAIQQWLEKRHKWMVNQSWLLYTNGIVAAISTAIMAYTKPGDKIMIHTPVYTPFFEMIEKNDRIVVHSPLIQKNAHYGIDFGIMEKRMQEGISMFILCNPHNPVGRVWSEAELRKIGLLCQQYDCLILSDEIHSDIVFKDFRHIPIASLSDDLLNRTVTFVAPSKTFNLAGLQASATIIANEKLRIKFDEASKRQGFFTLNTFGVVGMEAAYQYGECWLDELLIYLQKNISYTKDFLKEHLSQVEFTAPEGTYLLWLDFRSLSLREEELIELLIEKGQLALEPGSKYGPGGEGFMRLNVACPRSLLKEALERLTKALADR